MEYDTAGLVRMQETKAKPVGGNNLLFFLFNSFFFFSSHLYMPHTQTLEHSTTLTG